MDTVSAWIEIVVYLVVVATFVDIPVTSGYIDIFGAMFPIKWENSMEGNGIND